MVGTEETKEGNGEERREGEQKRWKRGRGEKQEIEGMEEGRKKREYIDR